jgi:hypothetical protein
VLKSDGGIDYRLSLYRRTPIYFLAASGSEIRQCQRDATPSERGPVHPWERRASEFELFLDDPAAGLFNKSVAAPAQLGEQR